VRAAWITRTQAERVRTLRPGRNAAAPHSPVSRQEIADLIGACSDILTVLRNASETDKAEVSGSRSLRLIYQPEHRTVRAEAWLSTDSQWQFPSVRGGT